MPESGFEPLTQGFSVQCSTAELFRPNKMFSILIIYIIFWLFINNFFNLLTQKVEILFLPQTILQNLNLNFCFQIFFILILIFNLIKNNKQRFVYYLTFIFFFILAKKGYWYQIITQEYNYEPSFETSIAFIHPILLNLSLCLLIILLIYLNVKIIIFLINILGMSIMLGSLWAYEELNWGGFWFYDEIENFSILFFIFILKFLPEHMKSLKTFKTLKFWEVSLIFYLFFFGKFFLVESIHKFSSSLNFILDYDFKYYNIIKAITILLIGIAMLAWLKLAINKIISIRLTKEILIQKSISLVSLMLIILLIASFNQASIAIPINRMVMAFIILLLVIIIEPNHNYLKIFIIYITLCNDNIFYFSINDQSFLLNNIFIDNSKITINTVFENYYLFLNLDFKKDIITSSTFFIKKKTIGYLETSSQIDKICKENFNIFF